MKILICSWNDADTIRRTLNSVREYEVHIFDGRFNDFPGESWDSTDETPLIVADYPNVTWHDAVPGENQCEKRTRMFSVLEEGEYGFKLDADEVLLVPMGGGNKLEHDVYWVWTLSNAYDYPYMKPMIFKKHEGMHYADKHHYLFDAQKRLITSDQNMGENYTHANLNIRVFNIRDRNNYRDKAKLFFLAQRKEAQIQSENEVYGEQSMRLQEYRAFKPRQSVHMLTPPQPTQYTFGATFSRPWAFKRFISNLDQVILPVPCEIVAIVDHNDHRFYREVQDELTARAGRFPSGIKTFFTNNPPPFEKRKVNERRLRISKAMHIILTEARGDILLGGEDDSLPKHNAYTKLLADMNANSADFVQGTIVGRWQPMIPAWHVHEENGELTMVSTGNKATGLEEIQGIGWYCFAAKTDAMRAVPINWDLCKHVGPDFHMGYYMWKAGYRLLHDHDVHVTHFGEDFELTLNSPTVVCQWKKVDDLWQSTSI